MEEVGGGAEVSSSGELCPLFHQPGKPGFYSIRVGPNTPSRLNAYRNIGRQVSAVFLLDCFLSLVHVHVLFSLISSTLLTCSLSPPSFSSSSLSLSLPVPPLSLSLSLFLFFLSLSLSLPLSLLPLSLSLSPSFSSSSLSSSSLSSSSLSLSSSFSSSSLSLSLLQGYWFSIITLRDDASSFL